MAIDFAQESLDAALERSEYDPHVPAFFGWLGVTMYLDHDTVFDALEAIRNLSAGGSHLVFDYLDSDAFDPSKSSQSMQEAVGNQGTFESWTPGFDPKALETELSRIGFGVREDVSHQETEARYFRERSDGYHAMEHAHFVWAVVE